LQFWRDCQDYRVHPEASAQPRVQSRIVSEGELVELGKSDIDDDLKSMTINERLESNH
jgi:hypothetical protein